MFVMDKMKSHHIRPPRVKALPRLELLVTFKTVADMASFNRASAILNRTQSAVSHQIRKLEQELGVALFYRSAHKVQLTERGTALLAEIVEPLSRIEAALEMIRSDGDPPRLTVELEPSLSANWLTPNLKSFEDAFPKLRLAIHLSTHRLEFSGSTELAVKWGSGKWPGFDSRLLWRSRFTPMCSPKLLENSGPLQLPNDLKAHVLLHDRNYRAWTSWLQLAKAAEVNPRSGHIIDDTNVLTEAAINGRGIGLCAIELTHRALQRGDLVAPFKEIQFVPDEAYYILTKSGRQPQREAQSFIEWLLTTARQTDVALRDKYVP